MSQQIDPRLYASGPQSYSQQRPFDSSTRLPRIDQMQQLPPLSSAAPISQPYFRLPPANSSQHMEHAHEDAAEHYSTPREPYGDYDVDDSLDPRGGGDPNDPKRPRACEACRGLKVRCDRDESQPQKPCKRCWKARRECVVTAPSRKRQKKTDSRVAELEKKIDALTRSLNAQNAEGQLSPPQSTYSASTAPTMQTPEAVNANSSLWHRNVDASHSRPPSTERKKRPIEKSKDSETLHPPLRPRSSRTDDSESAASTMSVDMNGIDAIIDQETASRVFDRYVAEMARHLPAVTFEKNTTAADIRTCRPVLFLAILDAASLGMLEMSTQLRLNKLLLEIFAISIIRNGEKSLDLIQALMVSSIWYRPPIRYEQMNVYLLTHLSALMALDFGMGKKLNIPQNWRIATNVGQAHRPQTFLNSDSVEARRTWLGCYFQCITVSLSMRRPIFIRWNSHLEECLKVLESAPEALPSDKLLCQHIKLMHIKEEVGQRFSMDDRSASIVITDPRVQFAIRNFDERLDDWCAGVPRDLWDPTLTFSSYFCRLYIHEVALHNNHNVDDFRAPFTEESIKTPSLQARHLSPYHSGLLKQCLTSVHGMIDTFISFDKVTVKAMPMFYFVRVAYAVVILIKLYYAVTLPNANLSLKESDLQVDHYLDNLYRVIQTISEEEAFRPAKKFMMIVGKLREGFHRDRVIRPHVPGEKDEQGDNKSPAGQEREQSRRTSQGHHAGVSTADQDGEGMTAPKYNQMQTPLHFLSEVATNDSLGIQRQPQQQQPHASHVHDDQRASGWYQGQNHGGQPIMVSGMEYSNGVVPGFEQAVDLTMGIGEGDLSSLFMEDSGAFGYGPPGISNEGGVAMGMYGASAAW